RRCLRGRLYRGSRHRWLASKYQLQHTFSLCSSDLSAEHGLGLLLPAGKLEQRETRESDAAARPESAQATGQCVHHIQSALDSAGRFFLLLPVRDFDIEHDHFVEG